MEGIPWKKNQKYKDKIQKKHRIHDQSESFNS